MHIILDANAYVADFRMESISFRNLFDYLKKTKSLIVLPRLVREEVVAAYVRRFRTAEKTFINAQSEYDYLSLSSDRSRPRRRDARYLGRDIRKKLRDPFEGIKPKYCATVGGIDVDEIYMRGIQRTPPASVAGEELRDVILWLFVLSYASESNDAVAFITNDKGFWKGDYIDPQIKKDMEEKNVVVAMYRDIAEFIRTHAPAPRDIDAVWIDKIAPSTELRKDFIEAARKGLKARRGMHLWQIPSDANIRTIEILAVRMLSGQAYDVSEKVIYLEVRYTVSFNAVVVNYIPTFEPKVSTYGGLMGTEPLLQQQAWPAYWNRPFFSGSLGSLQQQSISETNVQEQEQTFAVEMLCSVALRLEEGQLTEREVTGVEIKSIDKIAKLTNHDSGGNPS